MNTNKTEIQQAIEQALKGRLIGLAIRTGTRAGKPTKAALQEQAAFLAGAGAALQAVFGHNHSQLTEYFSPSWLVSVLRGELINR